MGITRNELKTIRPGAGNQQKLSEMTGIVRKYWCPFVELWGQCNGFCSENEVCANSLGTAIDGIRPGAERWQAVLIFQLREVRASYKEQFEKPKLKADCWGHIETGYGLKDLSQELGVSL